MDPDYELPELTRKEANKRREKEKWEQLQRAKTRINEDFKMELDQREQQMIEIQNRITCLAKTLHVLRYVLVSNYYNKPETQQPVDDELNIYGKQNRLHPAVKRLINEEDLVSLDFSKRQTRQATKPVNVMPIEETVTAAPEIVTTKEENTEQNAVAIKCEAPRNRQMFKQVVIIGNISKYMPSTNPEDNSTHKWMVYVRGPPEKPNIDDIVEKVIFHLHPSYHPHDVIEVMGNPFHLSRRGWGEFPMRCKLVFKSPLNKPVDIIHNLKLDKTYSGRQTLGSETVAELTLYNDNIESIDTEYDCDQIIKSEPGKMPMDISANADDSLGELHSEFIIKEEVVENATESLTDESIDVMETSLVDKGADANSYYEYCPALTDHTYSLRTVKSC